MGPSFWFFVPAAFMTVGMFFVGWFAHAWVVSRREAEQGPDTHMWRCPGCGKQKELPASLEARVLVCNNCNVRLQRD